MYSSNQEDKGFRSPQMNRGSAISVGPRRPSRPTVTSVNFTDWTLLFALMLVLFWGIDPFGIGLWRYSGTRHVPTAFMLIALFLGVVGRKIFRSEGLAGMGESVRLFGPLIAFSLFVIAGSLVARLALGEQHTFLSLGLFLLLGGPVTYWLIVTSSNPEAMARYISGAFLAFSAIALAMKLVPFSVVTYHAYEHIVIVCAAFPMLASKKFASIALGAILVAFAS